MTKKVIDSSAEAILASVALLGATYNTDQPPAASDPPLSDEEILAYIRHTVSEEQETIIEELIAHNPATYDRFLQLSSRSAKHSQLVSLVKKGWEKICSRYLTIPGPQVMKWAAASCCLMVAGLITLPGVQQTEQAVSSEESSRPRFVVVNEAANVNEVNWQDAAFGRGFEARSPFGRVVNSFGSSLSEDCPSVDGCSLLVDQLIEFGVVLSRSVERCRDSGGLTSSQQDSLRQLSLNDQLELKWRRALARIQSTASSSPDRLCAMVISEVRSLGSSQ